MSRPDTSDAGQRHNPKTSSEKEIEPIEERQRQDEEAGHAPPPQPPSSKLEATSSVLSRVASRMTTRSLPDPGPPPDGGLKAWTQAVMAWIVWGYVNSYGTFQAYYVSALNESPSTISWIGSVQVWILFFLGAFSGRALDAGYFLPAYVIGIVIQVLGIFMTSLATKYWQLFLTQAVCTGIGSGIFFCPSMALLSTYFSKHRGVAVALATTGNSAGGMIYPLVVRQLLPRVGFAWTIRVLGFMNLGSLVVVLAFMRPRLPPRKAGPVVEWAAFKEPEYVLFVGGLCFLAAPLYFTYYYIASFGRAHLGMSYADSVVLLIIFNGIGIPFRVLTGYISDRYLGVLNTFIPLLVFNTLLAYCWMAVKDQLSLYVFTCFYGVAIASWQSLLPTSVASLTKDISKTGSRFGMAFTVMGFAALIGPPLAGALISAQAGRYVGAQAWAGTSSAVGVCLVVGARVYRYGWRLMKC